MIIYDVANHDACIAVTDPASLRQIIQALKNEGIIRRNCRYASYTMATMGQDGIAIMKGGKTVFCLWPAFADNTLPGLTITMV